MKLGGYKGMNMTFLLHALAIQNNYCHVLTFLKMSQSHDAKTFENDF